MRHGVLFVLSLVLIASPVGVAAQRSGGSYGPDGPDGRVQGTVEKIEEPLDVVVLHDGRMFQIVAGSEVLVDGKPARVAQLRPGDRVVILAGMEVVLRDGAHVPVDYRGDGRTGSSR